MTKVTHKIVIESIVGTLCNSRTHYLTLAYVIRRIELADAEMDCARDYDSQLTIR